MEPNPRSKSWMYIIPLLSLFFIAVVSPRLWRSLNEDQKSRIKASLTGAVDPVEHHEGEITDAESHPRRIHVDFDPNWLQPDVARFDARVAQRVVIHPEIHSPNAFENGKVITGDVVPGDVVPGEMGDDEVVSEEVGVGEVGVGEVTIERHQGPADKITPPDFQEFDTKVESSSQPSLRLSAPTSRVQQVDVNEIDVESPSTTLPSDPPSQEIPEVVEVPSEWPEMSALYAALDEFCVDVPIAEAWRAEGVHLLSRLQRVETLDDSEVERLLLALKKLADALPQVERWLDEPDCVPLRQLAYGIERRLEVWQAMHRLAKNDRPLPRVNVAEALPLLNDVEEKLARGENGDGWRSYLMLDRLTQIATSTWVTDPSVRHEVSREVLRRMNDKGLGEQQKAFIESSELQQLVRMLQSWAVSRVDYPKFARTLEQFEASRSAALATQLVNTMEDVRWAKDTTELTNAFNTHYRNANVRLSITGQLVNDFLPILEPIEENIRDNVMGASVQGKNNTWTQLRVKLFEDDERIRLRFIASGNTRSRTVSRKGFVRFFSNGNSNFLAGKELQVSRQGIFAHDATASANGRTKVVDLETDYDHIPLVGWVMRQMAMEELHEQRNTMKSVMTNRVSKAARTRLDESLQERITDYEGRLNEKIMAPLRELQLDPSAIEMRSTAERIVLRCRIASAAQLAAYTPRPRALKDSVMSMQFHESSANNLLEQLELDGQVIDLEELIQKLSERLEMDVDAIREELPEGVKLRLGQDRPIQIEFDDHRILVTFRIAELSTPRRKWRNFVVRGKYRADMGRLHVDLERDGGIELISEQLGFRDQIALRGIFTKVMTRNHRLNVMRGRFLEDPRLSNLGVTQFVVRDGWVGLSIGPPNSPKVATETPVTAR